MNFAVEGVRSPCLLPVAEAFSANVVRTATFAIMPAQISGFLLAESETKMAETEHTVALGIGYIETLSSSRPMAESLDALLSMVVLDSWTAFECLAADLWVAAVDASPVLRKRLNAKLHKLRRPSDMELEQSDDELPNPDAGFGSALRDNHQISFQKLPFIVRHYKIIFGKQIRDLFYNTNETRLIALAAVRNLLTHKAGRVDAHFLGKVATIPEFSAVQPDSRLKLDGEIVNKLRDAAISTGTKLLAHVDDFLIYADGRS